MRFLKLRAPPILKVILFEWKTNSISVDGLQYFVSIALLPVVVKSVVQELCKKYIKGKVGWLQ